MINFDFFTLLEAAGSSNLMKTAYNEWYYCMRLNKYDPNDEEEVKAWINDEYNSAFGKSVSKFHFLPIKDYVKEYGFKDNDFIFERYDMKSTVVLLFPSPDNARTDKILKFREETSARYFTDVVDNDIRKMINFGNSRSEAVAKKVAALGYIDMSRIEAAQKYLDKKMNEIFEPEYAYISYMIESYLDENTSVDDGAYYLSTLEVESDKLWGDQVRFFNHYSSYPNEEVTEESIEESFIMEAIDKTSIKDAGRTAAMYALLGPLGMSIKYSIETADIQRAGSKAKPMYTGKWEEFERLYEQGVNKIKSLDTLLYIRRDLYNAIRSFPVMITQMEQVEQGKRKSKSYQKMIDGGNSSTKMKKHLKWCETKGLDAVNKRISEVRNRNK